MSTTDIIITLAESLRSVSWKLIGIVIIAGCLAMIYKWIEKKILSIAATKAYERKQKKYEELISSKTKESESTNESDQPSIYQAQHGEWSPTGWVYDRDTKKWDPPDYLSKESEEKWRWNEEKRIWIDTEKEKRQEKHKQWRQEEGKGPTFEEWKAERQKNT